MDNALSPELSAFRDEVRSFIAANLAVDHYRAEAGRPREILPLEDCAEQACPRPGPEQVASARQTLARLAAAVEQLPPRCREVFLRHKFDGCRQADLAREYGISVNLLSRVGSRFRQSV